LVVLQPEDPGEVTILDLQPTLPLEDRVLTVRFFGRVSVGDGKLLKDEVFRPSVGESKVFFDLRDEVLKLLKDRDLSFWVISLGRLKSFIIVLERFYSNLPRDLITYIWLDEVLKY
jgi:hypothetical protein